MTVIQVDMTDAAEGGAFNKVNVEEDNYLAKITKAEIVEVKTGDNKGDKQILLTVQLPAVPRASYPYYLQTKGAATFKLRNVLEACGMRSPKAKANLETDRLVGKPIGVAMVDTEYKGKTYSEIDNVFSTAELTAEQRGAKKAVKKTEVEDLEGDDDTAAVAADTEIDLEEL